MPVTEVPGSNPARSSVGLGGECAVLGFILKVSSRGIFPLSFLHQSYSNLPIAKCHLHPIRFVFLERPKFYQIIELLE